MTSNDVLSCTHHEDQMTKATYRFKVWNLLENKDLVMFPRPCKGRIPNFVACNVAAEKLTTLDVFKKAGVIKVNLDKPQEQLRLAVLEEGKVLVVPVPSLVDGVVMKICPPENASRGQLLLATKPKGASIFGKIVDVNDKMHVDMVVIGSVAVSKEGHRIGKGEGYSDLEYALMAATGLVSEETVVVTTVHDDQVFDQMPEDLFRPFDVHVDFIVTPTQVIEVSPRLAKPKGVLWNMVSDRRLQRIPILKTLRSKQIEEGQDCALKEVDSEPEDRPRPYRFRDRPFSRGQRGRPYYGRGRYYDNRNRQGRQYTDRSQDSRRSNSPVDDAPPPRRTRTFFRRGGNRRRPMDGSGDQEAQANGHSQEQGRGHSQEGRGRRIRNQERRTRDYSQEGRGRDGSREKRQRYNDRERDGRQERNGDRERNGRQERNGNRERGGRQERDGRKERDTGRQGRDSSQEGRDYSQDGDDHSQERRGGRRVNRRVNGENKENQTPHSRPQQLKRYQNRFKKFPVDFSVKVGNIDTHMRVRDLKAALIEKGVRPRDITWRGPKGFALLHFAKMKAEEEQQPMAVDDVIASLQNLTVKCSSEEEVGERRLSVEPAKPISRIEDAGVTAV